MSAPEQERGAGFHNWTLSEAIACAAIFGTLGGGIDALIDIVTKHSLNPLVGIGAGGVFGALLPAIEIPPRVQVRHHL